LVDPEPDSPIIEPMVALLALILAAQAVEPNAQNFQQWLTFIQPDAKDRAGGI
jgi:hypothetical protein